MFCLFDMFHCSAFLTCFTDTYSTHCSPLCDYAYMSFQTLIIKERLFTMGARMQLLPCMDAPYMFTHFSSLRKVFVAMTTLVWLFTSVSKHVLIQSTYPSEWLVAMSTLVKLFSSMSTHVIIQRSFPHE